MADSAETVVEKTKKKITKKRIEIQDDKAEAGKLGPVTKAILPEDFSVMYAGKMCILSIKNSVASRNILSAYIRDYPDLSPDTLEELKTLQGEFSEDFERAKARTNKIASKHPLYKRLGGIKGISAYQIALLMSYIKDISRFDTPTKLCVYAGMASVNGMPVIKANINRIKDYMFETRGREFKGFNTELSGRMFVIVDCLIRSKGYFYNMYCGLRIRLEKRSMNEGSCFQATAEDRKASGNVMEIGKYYMKNKKNQSLIMWSDKNAKRRIARTFLHLFYAEWRTLLDLPVRNPYPVDYLGHNSLITLEEVLKADSVKNSRPRKAKVAPELPEMPEGSEGLIEE